MKVAGRVPLPFGLVGVVFMDRGGLGLGLVLDLRFRGSLESHISLTHSEWRGVHLLAIQEVLDGQQLESRILLASQLLRGIETPACRLLTHRLCGRLHANK